MTLPISDKIELFRALHVPGDPLVLFNNWDGGSAKVVAEAGARAIATGSYGVAVAQGYKDGEGFPLARALPSGQRVNSVRCDGLFHRPEQT